MKSWFEDFPFAEPCSLEVEGPREAHSPEDAWNLLPTGGEGWISLVSELRVYEPGRREGTIVQAEVADGSDTVVLRYEDGVWRAWTWREKQGDSHRVVRRVFLSTVPGRDERFRTIRYGTYWKKVEDEDHVKVWQPVGSRFLGWEGRP